MNKNILKLFTACLIFVSACNSNKEFEAPNKKEIKTGMSKVDLTANTAMKLSPNAEKMAKVWSEDAFLVGINGNNISIEGYNLEGSNLSQWIYTYFSSKISKTYTVVFRGDAAVTWLESEGSFKIDNSIANFAVDSNTAMINATKNGLPVGKIYSMELAKNAKGMYWYVGSRQESNSAAYTVKKVDALSGNVK